MNERFSSTRVVEQQSLSPVGAGSFLCVALSVCRRQSLYFDEGWTWRRTPEESSVTVSSLGPRGFKCWPVMTFQCDYHYFSLLGFFVVCIMSLRFTCVHLHKRAERRRLRRNSWSPADDRLVSAEWTDGGVVEKRASDVILSPLWPIDLLSFSLSFLTSICLQSCDNNVFFSSVTSLINDCGLTHILPTQCLDWRERKVKYKLSKTPKMHIWCTKAGKKKRQ